MRIQLLDGLGKRRYSLGTLFTAQENDPVDETAKRQSHGDDAPGGELQEESRQS